MSNGVEVHVVSEAFRKAFRVYITQMHGTSLMIARPGKGDAFGVGWEMECADPGADIDPSMWLPEEWAEGLLAAFRNVGVKDSQRDHELGAALGRLEATEKHLADMRALALPREDR